MQRTCGELEAVRDLPTIILVVDVLRKSLDWGEIQGGLHRPGAWWLPSFAVGGPLLPSSACTL